MVDNKIVYKKFKDTRIKLINLEKLTNNVISIFIELPISNNKMKNNLQENECLI